MDTRDEEAFIQNDKLAICGSINGIILYSLLWPFLVKTILVLCLGNNYNSFVENNYSLATMILLIGTSLITLLIGVVIANPKKLIKTYKKLEKGNIKFIFSCFGVMLLFNYVYNFTLILSGVDVIGGNANQMEVVSMITDSPWLAFFSMVLVAPILEEVTYRYFLYGGIAKHNRKLAIVLSGFIFMCVHAIASFESNAADISRELLLLPPYMFSGMVLAYSYDKKQNLLIPTSIHILNNLISFILCVI